MITMHHQASCLWPTVHAGLHWSMLCLGTQVVNIIQTVLYATAMPHKWSPGPCTWLCMTTYISHSKYNNYYYHGSGDIWSMMCIYYSTFMYTYRTSHVARSFNLTWELVWGWSYYYHLLYSYNYSDSDIIIILYTLLLLVYAAQGLGIGNQT